MSIKKLDRHPHFYPNSKNDLDNPEERARLKPRYDTYWMPLGHGRHIGYRVGLRGKFWFARIRLWNGVYRLHRLGRADDCPLREGQRCISYEHARDKCVRLFELYSPVAVSPQAPVTEHMTLPRPDSDDPYTVTHAMADFVEWRRRNLMNFPRDIYTSKLHIVPELGHIPLKELSTPQIVKWFHELPFKPLGGPHNYTPPPKTPEELRPRRKTANTTLFTLRAALEHAFLRGYTDRPEVWRRIRRFRLVEAYNARFLEKDECQRLLRACDPAISLLVKGALLTGCRIGELKRLRVRDYKKRSGKLVIIRPKFRTKRIVTLSDAGVRFFSTQTRDRPRNEHMFLMADGRPWYGGIHQYWIGRASAIAGIKPPISFLGLRHTYCSHAVMAGMPRLVLARQLGHKTTETIDCYYGHLSKDFVDRNIRKYVPDLAGDL